MGLYKFEFEFEFEGFKAKLKAEIALRPACAK